MKKKPIVEFSKQQRKDIILDMQEFFSDHLELELNNLQGELLLDYITEKIGSFYYNVGIEKSIEYMYEKTEDLCLLMKIESKS